MRRGLVALSVVAIIAAGCGDDDEVSDSTTTATSTTTSMTTTSSTIPGPPESTTPDGTPIVFSSWQELDAGTTYSSNPGRMPVLRFTPPIPGWSAKDSLACAYDLGTMRFAAADGRVFVVGTPDDPGGVNVDEAVEMLLEGPFVDPTVAGTEIADWSGKSVTATLDDGVNTNRLGTRGGGSLLPYHVVTEDGLDIGAVSPGDDAEIHVVDTDTVILSVVLVTDPGGMQAFRPDALALADTIEVVASRETADEGC